MTQKAIVFHKDNVLLSHHTVLRPAALWHDLGLNMARNVHFNSVDLIELATIEEYSSDLFKNSRWVTIREAVHLISPQEFSMLVRGISLIRWDKHHQFCGGCAKKTVLTSQSFERHCADCQIDYYPRISPAIIVLIRRHDDILMARSAHFPPGVYGLIAGFVETGETLEETVHREVLEEVGIKIKQLSYYGSQPWPFPDSLMVGFTAEYESGEILVDQKELEDAGWYRYDQLPGLPSFPMSIAFEMIRQFKPKNP